MRRLIAVAVLATLAGCSSSAPDTQPTGTSPTVVVTTTTTNTTSPTNATATASTSVSPPVPVATTVTQPTSAPSAASTTSTSVASTQTDTVAPTAVPATPDEVRVLGASVDGRPIVATRRAAPGGARGTPIVVIGAIHGDEDAGMAITERLAALDVPAGLDMWIIPTMNPDGVADDDRHNAHQVDLNRNFPYRWGPIGRPGDPQYAGTGPASEPETQAIVAFLDEIQPAMVIWYHQDLDRIAPSTGHDGRIRARYAELTGVPLLRITGGTYTGVAATWARQTLPDAVAFIVELGPTLSDEQAETHAAAVLTVAGEL